MALFVLILLQALLLPTQIDCLLPPQILLLVLGYCHNVMYCSIITSLLIFNIKNRLGDYYAFDVDVCVRIFLFSSHLKMAAVSWALFALALTDYHEIWII